MEKKVETSSVIQEYDEKKEGKEPEIDGNERRENHQAEGSRNEPGNCTTQIRGEAPTKQYQPISEVRRLEYGVRFPSQNIKFLQKNYKSLRIGWME